MADQDAINAAEWADPGHWTMPVGFYFSKRDSRWLVPRKPRWLGWTFNLGHPVGAWATLATLLLPILVLVAVNLALVLRK